MGHQGGDYPLLYFSSTNLSLFSLSALFPSFLLPLLRAAYIRPLLPEVL